MSLFAVFVIISPQQESKRQDRGFVADYLKPYPKFTSYLNPLYFVSVMSQQSQLA